MLKIIRLSLKIMTTIFVVFNFHIESSHVLICVGLSLHATCWNVGGHAVNRHVSKCCFDFYLCLIHLQNSVNLIYQWDFAPDMKNLKSWIRKSLDKTWYMKTFHIIDLWNKSTILAPNIVITLVNLNGVFHLLCKWNYWYFHPRKNIEVNFWWCIDMVY